MVRGGEASWVRFVVLRILSNSVSLVGRVLISPCSTLLIAGDEEPIAQANLREKMKIEEYHHVHGRDMLGRIDPDAAT